ncbi:MAG: hypothetical protein GY856_33250 [bacterium]|nr:hypothetical protein [bacterium]
MFFIRDLRHVLGSFVRHPGWTALAALTLAVGHPLRAVPFEPTGQLLDQRIAEIDQAGAFLLRTQGARLDQRHGQFDHLVASGVDVLFRVGLAQIGRHAEPLPAEALVVEEELVRHPEAPAVGQRVAVDVGKNARGRVARSSEKSSISISPRMPD